MGDYLGINDTKLANTTRYYDAVFTNEEIMSLVGRDMTSGDEIDVLSYTVVCNTWCMYATDVLGTRLAGNALRNIIIRDGLLDAISMATQLYDAYRADDEFWTDDFKHEAIRFDLWPWEPIFGGDRVTVLSVLAYPRRFSSPTLSKTLKEESLASFKKVNESCLLWQNHCLRQMAAMDSFERIPALSGVYTYPYSQYMLDNLREIYAKIFMGVPDLTKFPMYDINTYGKFSAGATQEVAKKHSCIAMKLANSAEIFVDNDHPLLCRDHTYWDIEWRYINGYYLPYGRLIKGDRVDISRVQAVPKTYKSNRIIAIETSYNSYLGQALATLLEHYIADKGFKAAYRKDDQGQNRHFVWVGSNDDSYASIDMSSASDSISREFSRNFFPRRIHRMLMNYASNKIEIGPSDLRKKKKGGQELVNSGTLLTSGTALTFLIESIVFYGICRLAYDIYERYTGLKLLPIGIYGDDCVVDIRVYELVCDILTKLQFKVNESKSFGNETSYKESCGVECFKGYHYSPIYFPRKGLGGNRAEMIATLTSLQHKFYYVSPSATRFLEEVVLTLCPWMTYHKAPCDCVDLWGSRDRVSEYTYPVYAPLNACNDLPKAIRFIGFKAIHTDYKIGLHATLKSQPILISTDEVTRRRCERFLYLTTLRDVNALVDIPYCDTVITVLPEGKSRETTLYPAEVGWVLAE